MSRRDSDSEKVPAALYDRLTDTPTYAARMYKVQLYIQKKALPNGAPPELELRLTTDSPESDVPAGVTELRGLGRSLCEVAPADVG